MRAGLRLSTVSGGGRGGSTSGRETTPSRSTPPATTPTDRDCHHARRPPRRRFCSGGSIVRENDGREACKKPVNQESGMTLFNGDGAQSETDCAPSVCFGVRENSQKLLKTKRDCRYFETAPFYIAQVSSPLEWLTLAYKS